MSTVNRNEIEVWKRGGLDRETLLDRGSAKIYEGAGFASISCARRTNRGKPKVNTRSERDNQQIAASRSRRNLIALVRKAKPSSLVTLTFSNPPTPHEANLIWKKHLRTWKREESGFYVRVAEFSGLGKIHFHILCPGSLAQFLKASWDYGFVDVRNVQFSDLDRVCNYLSKGFASTNRPFPRRFVASRGHRPRVIEIGIGSLIEGIDAISMHESVEPDKFLTEIVRTQFGEFAEVRWNV
jgi:hypothetical protein